MFCRCVAGLERMLRVRARTENTSGVGHCPAFGKRDLVTDAQVQGVASGRCFAKHSACEVFPVDTNSVAASLPQVPTNILPDPVLQSVSGDFEFKEPNILPDPVLQTVSGDFEFKRDLEDGIVAVRASTAGERNHSRLLEVIESVFLCLINRVENSSPSSLRVSSHVRAHEICLAAASACLSDPHSARRSLPALTDAHADDPLMHVALNSGRSDTGNSLRVQRSTSYNLQGVAAHNSRRKVRLSCTVGSRYAEQTVDMSPAPAAGTYRRSADKVHDQRQVSRKRQAESSGGGPGPGPGTGPGGRSGLVGGVLGLAAACLKIPCSLEMPPGRHQFAPQSLGWARVCGTENSGVWVLKGDARTYNLPWNLDDVGVDWERRSGYETAWATPGHVCSCSYDYGHGAVLPQANPSVFTEAVNLWSRVASLLTPWCAKGEVPTGVNPNRHSGNGSFIPWHRDNERLFGSPFEPKVIVSMSLGHSALFKLRRRTPENTPSQIWLDHGDLLVMDGLTQYEYEHSTASELEGPRVNLTYRWISQHIRSCPLAGLIGGALPSDAQDLAEPHSRGGGVEEIKMSMTCLMALLVVLGTCFLRKYVFDAYEGVRCRNYYCGLSQRWKIPRRSHLMENWLFHFLAMYEGVKASFLCHFYGIYHLLIASVTYGEPTPGNYYMHDVVSPKGAFWGSSWQMHDKTRYSPTVGFLLP